MSRRPVAEPGTLGVGQPDGSALVPTAMQLQIIRNKVSVVAAETVWCAPMLVRPSESRAGDRARRARRLASRPPAAVARGGVRHHRHQADRLVLAQAHVVPRARLSGRGRLHGPRQLGDLARRRLEVRLRAADRRAAVQPDGDPAAGAVRAAWHRRRPRSGAGLPRRVSARGVVAALGAGGDRDLRHRPGRGDRHRDRAQSAVRHSARNRRADHRARRVPDPVDAEPRLPLDRGLHRDAARRHRDLLCDPDRDGRSRMGRRDPRLRADHRDRHQSRHALSRASASSAPP